MTKTLCNNIISRNRCRDSKKGEACIIIISSQNQQMKPTQGVLKVMKHNANDDYQPPDYDISLFHLSCIPFHEWNCNHKAKAAVTIRGWPKDCQ